MTTSAGPDAGRPPGQRRWTWEYPVGPRWLLLGDVGFEGSYADDIPLALCAEIEGLFVDLPPWSRERFRLVGCVAAGALADLLDRLPAGALGTERAWLGDVSITEPAPPAGTRPSWWGEDLGDVAVLGQRPNITMPETVDVDLDGYVHVYDRTDAVPRPGDLTEFVLLGRDETPYGTCRDVTGVFREQAAPPVPQVRLLGCRSEPALLTTLGAVGHAADTSQRRRRIRAEVHAVGMVRTVTTSHDPSPLARDERVSTGSEREVLEAFLDMYRDIIVAKVKGVSAEAARHRLVPSTTTLAGLVRHLTSVEREWFGSVLDQRPASEVGVRVADDGWSVDSSDDVEGLAADYQRACAKSRRVASRFTLDDTVPMPRLGRVSLRWIYVHMIEETARHAGHADILREQTDGATGFDG